MVRSTSLSRALAAALFTFACFPSSAQVRARITGPVDERQLQTLAGNTHRLARSEFDQGKASGDLALNRMLLVLKRSPAQESALKAFLESQLDPHSPNYHHWLTPKEFGSRFGAADQDVKTVTAWLQSHGFTVNRVSNGRNVVDFSGTASQVAQAFHTEIHRYLVNGKQHIANASDPQIPAALAPVIAGVPTLHDFRKAPQIAGLKRQLLQRSAGSQPAYTAADGSHALSPADFATIYNLNPLFAKEITGAGSTIAVVARTNIVVTDVASFRSAFGLSVNPLQIFVNGPDPGDVGDGDEAEAVLDASWAGATAPGATVKLIVSQTTATTDGVDLSELYIVDDNAADIMTESYGDCEANYSQAGADFYASLAQQAAAQGITFTVAAGDSGAEGCDDPNSETTATRQVSVNILASSPYDIAVGGTEFNDSYSTSFWTTTGSNYSSATSYITENAWNESCTAAACGSNAGIWAGGGGASSFFSKPSWQAGVTGIPADGLRDLPDVSFTSAAHDFYLICLDGSCIQPHGRSFFAGVSGTSAATPSFAGIMALVLQQTGARQGQAASTLYSLAAQETLGECDASSTSALPSSSCVFNDATSGNNAVPGETAYGSATAQYQAGTGYDLATGLGSANATNLVTNWPASTSAQAAQIHVNFDSPSAQNSIVMSTVTFSGWALADVGTVSSVLISVDSVPYGAAAYGLSRPDICASFPNSANCPNVGWSSTYDTTQLPNGSHQVDVTVTTSGGQVYTASASMNVENWTPDNPMSVTIDTPNSHTAPLSGTVNFGGWAFDNLSAITGVSVTIDGQSFGNAVYGGNRQDVCNAHPGKPGCPNVGWNFLLNSAQLSDGAHSLTVTPVTSGGQHASVSAAFQVANYPSNPITIDIDSPSAGSTLTGAANFGGWAIATSTPISNLTIVIDGVSVGKASYGFPRPDVCASRPGRPSCPNVGWNYFVDTTHLNYGLHILTITASTSAGQSVSQTRSFRVANSTSANSVLVNIDQPGTQSSILTGQTSFFGWALNQNGAILAPLVYIDGAFYGKATYGQTRTDVCQVYPAGGNCPNVGWSIPVDTTLLANGSHTMTVVAFGSAPNLPVQSNVSGTFTVANWSGTNPMNLSIDRPSSTTGSVSGVLGMGGWVIDQLARISSIRISVDDVPFGSGSYGGVRNDVCAAYAGAIGCPNVGWNAALDTSLLADGNHELEVTATTVTGRSSTFTSNFTVANSGSVPVQVTIDTPTYGETLSGVAPIGGWAIDNNGQLIDTVEIYVDGVLAGTAQYGGSRADVCARHASAGGCPNVGWNYQLDTAVFSNGGHYLEARAVSADGHAYTAETIFFASNQP